MNMAPSLATGHVRNLVTLLLVYLAAAGAPLAAVMSETPAESKLLLLVGPDSRTLPSSPEDLVEEVESRRNENLLNDLGNPFAATLLTTDRLPTDTRLALPRDDPKRLLDTYVVLYYANSDEAQVALKRLRETPGVQNVEVERSMHFSNTPADPLFPFVAGSSSTMARQWGMRTLNLEATWAYHFGPTYVGILDSGIYPLHEDLQWSYRPHFSSNFLPTDCHNSVDEAQRYGSPTLCGGSYPNVGHGTMVAGIVAASNSNGVGVSGACWNCSLLIGRVASPTTRDLGYMANGINAMVARGAQVVNISLGLDVSVLGTGDYCSGNATSPICLAINLAVNIRQLLIVAAAGNDKDGYLDFPASDPRVIAAGGTQVNGTLWDQTVELIDAAGQISPARLNNPFPDPYENKELGTNYEAHGRNASVVVAPARDVLSTAYPNSDWNKNLRCGTTEEFYVGLTEFTVARYPFDGFPYAEDPPFNRQYGICTGTSFSSPHVTAVAALIRGADPLQTAALVTARLLQGASKNGIPDIYWGYGVPNAKNSVDSALSVNGRLTPLFALYSSFNDDYFLAISPQMATAAIWGTMIPAASLGRGRYHTYSWLGTYTTYSAFPTGAIPTQPPPITSDNYKPRARLKVFTTKKDAAGVDLCHIFRYSRSSPAIRHKYAVCAADRTANIPVGWDYDGVEGYMYPPTIPQPPGTVAVYRFTNPATGAFMLIPNGDQTFWATRGFQTDGTGILGYAYLN